MKTSILLVSVLSVWILISGVRMSNAFWSRLNLLTLLSWRSSCSRIRWWSGRTDRVECVSVEVLHIPGSVWDVQDPLPSIRVQSSLLWFHLLSFREKQSHIEFSLFHSLTNVTLHAGMEKHRAGVVSPTSLTCRIYIWIYTWNKATSVSSFS